MSKDRGIILRGDTFHINRTILGIQVRESLYTSNIKEARERVAEIERAIYMGSYVPKRQSAGLGSREAPADNRKTLKDAYKVAFALRWKNTKDAAGVAGRFETLTRFIPADTPLETIDRPRVVQFITDMSDATYTRQEGGQQYPYSPATVNRCIALLATLMELAADAGLIAAAPSFKRLKATERKRTRFFTPDEIATMFNHLRQSKLERDHRCLRLFGFLLASACRLREATGLTWEMVDLQQQLIHLPDTKSGKPVSKQLTAQAAQILLLEFDEGRAKPFDGCSETRIRDSWESALKSAGLEGDCDAVRHTLRHTAASWAVQRGCGLAQVQSFLGHSSINTTSRYAHLMVSHQAQVVGALEAVMNLCCDFAETRDLRENRDSGTMRSFNELPKSPIAQLVERRTVNTVVSVPLSVETPQETSS